MYGMYRNFFAPPQCYRAAAPTRRSRGPRVICCPNCENGIIPRPTPDYYTFKVAYPNPHTNYFEMQTYHIKVLAFGFCDQGCFYAYINKRAQYRYQYSDCSRIQAMVSSLDELSDPDSSAPCLVAYIFKDTEEKSFFKSVRPFFTDMFKQKIEREK